MSPHLSIVVIFRDEEQFLADALASVDAQTYGDWELLLVDDGSTDKSTEIAREYAAARPGRVRYLDHARHQNLGMSASRNAGIAASTGELITFLDADDVWAPDKARTQVAAMAGHPEVDLAVAPALYWHSWTGDPADTARDHRQQLVTETPGNGGTIVDPPALLLGFLRDEWRSICDLVVRRDAVLAIGGYEDRFRGMFEDQAFHAKLCLDRPVLVTADSGYRYRQHDDACTARAHADGDWLRARRQFLAWLEEYVGDRPGCDEARAEIDAQRRALRPARRLADRIGARLQLMGASSAAIATARAEPLRPVARQARDLTRTTKRRFGVWPPVGFVRFGSLGDVEPLGPMWPNRRGTPIDRHYIERFLAEEAAAIAGDVLEVGGLEYTQAFGTAVTSARILTAPDTTNPAVDFPVDLADGAAIPSDSFDCVVLPQTLLFVYDVGAAVSTLHRILRPGGVALVTVPGISHRVPEDQERWGQYWSFTRQSLERLFGDVFGSTDVAIESHGNVLAATAFLQGLAVGDLRSGALDHTDPDYPLILSVKATKAAPTARGAADP